MDMRDIEQEIRSLERGHADAREGLATDIENMIRTLTREAEYIRTTPDYYPNRLGILQGNALDIDRQCATLRQQKEEIERLVRLTA